MSFLKAINGVVNISQEVLPTPIEPTGVTTSTTFSDVK